MPKRVLIVKLGAIGDVIMAIPAAYQLHLAGRQIDWVCGATAKPVLACYPWINTIVADERALLMGSASARIVAVLALWRILPNHHYDLCATLYYDARYNLIAFPVHADRKLSLSQTGRARALLPGRHHTDEYARILAGRRDTEQPNTLAPVPAERLPLSPLPRDPSRRRVVLAPGGAKNLLRDDALRRWPAANYVALARTLLVGGLEVVLIGGPDDSFVAAAFAGLAVTDLIGKLTLPETLALLDDSHVLLTHDTGPLHLAGITRVGIIALFGPTDPRGRLPQRPGAVALWGGESFACRPCYDGRNYAACQNNGCIQQITPELVLSEITRMLDERESLSPSRVISPYLESRQ